MSEIQMINFAAELIAKASVAYLSTINQDGFPETRAMLNLRNPRQYPSLAGKYAGHETDFLTYFTTNASSRKFGQLQNNAKVSIYYARPQEWRGVMLGGEMEIITDAELKKELWQEGWTSYYPSGHDDPDYAVLRLQPMLAKVYYKFQVHNLALGRQ